MLIDRRRLIGLSAGLFALGPRRLFAATAAGPRYASCAKLPDGSFAAVLMDADGRILGLRPLPDRGHDIAHDPVSGRLVAFARRPGSFAVVFEADAGVAPIVLPAPEGRHFYGHGVFSPDGRRLYTTENDFAAGAGVVGIYDVAAGFERVGEMPTGGIGPHELVLLGDGRTLVVANGGLDTTPEFGRLDLNSADMEASLAVIDAPSGKLTALRRLPDELRKLSIRHLAVDAAGAVWFGCQYEGPPTDLPPLAGRLTADGTTEMFALPGALRARTRNYVGSVATSRDGDLVAFSAPRGGLIFAFDSATGRFAGTTRLADGCGIAATAGAGMLATSGEGAVIGLDFTKGDGSATPMAREDVAFDNHLTLIG